MLKRLFDLACVIPALILLLPVFIIIAIWIKFDSKGSVFYRQIRVGQYQRHFKMIKFRSMHRDSRGLELTVGEDDPRITRSGTFLRHYKLDELPQLINVLIGDMSLVGPRPEVPTYVAYYPEEAKQLIFSVPSGITDSASIAYRHENRLLAHSQDPERDYIETILPAKLACHQAYARHHSLIEDIRLIWRTLYCIFINPDLPQQASINAQHKRNSP